MLGYTPRAPPQTRAAYALWKGTAVMASDARSQYDAVVVEVTATSPATSGKMFGMPCLKSDSGKAFAGLYQEAMVFKLGGAAHARALALPGARPFDPMQGRPMKAWMEVSVEHAALWLEFARQAHSYVAEART